MNSSFKNKNTTIAIADETGKWQYLTFPSWDEARVAVNQARSEGKAAVFYDGATLPTPPSINISNAETETSD